MTPRFYLRKSKSQKGLRQLIIIYSLSTRYFKVDAGIPRITEGQWDQDSSRIINHTDADSLTAMATKNFLTIQKIVNDYLWNNDGKSPTSNYVRIEYEKNHENNLKKEIEVEERQDDKIDDIYFNYNLFLKEKKGIMRAPAHYKLVGDNLKQFLKNKNVLLQDIDMQFFKDFVAFYIEKKKLAKKKQTDNPYDNQTINKRIKSFKSFLKWMETDKNMVVNPAYKNFKTGLVEIEKRITILDNNEFKKVVEAEKHITLSPKHEYVRDLYVIQCLCGLRYSDVIRIRKHMVKGNEGAKTLEIDVRKIKKIANLKIPIIPLADTFLKRYDYNLDITL